MSRKGKQKYKNTGKNKKGRKARVKKGLFSSLTINSSIPGSSLDHSLKKVFYASFGVMLLLMIINAANTGINEDEKFHVPYSNALIDFYTTGGKDTSALFVDFGKMHLYGGFFDLTSGMINKVLGNDMELGTDYIRTRHILNALVGSIGILFAGLLARLLGGWQCGIIALFMIFFSPRYFGHAMMNPRDIPFASGYAMSLYFIGTILTRIPEVKWKDILGLTLGIGLALGARSGGLLLIAYTGLFLGIHYLLNVSGSSASSIKNPFTKPYAGVLFLAGFGGLILSLIFWPYGLVDPLHNILDSLTSFSNYRANIRLLFNGDLIFGQQLPLMKYIGTWLILTIPLVVLVGIVLSLVKAKGVYNIAPTLPLALALFSVVFPVAYILYKGSTLYDGWRHLLFLYPPIVALGSLGWGFLSKDLLGKRSKVSLVTTAGFILLLAIPAQFMVRNPQLSYTYFNPLRGGMHGNLGMMEQDYWGLSVKDAVEWLKKEKLQNIPEGESIRVASNFPYTTKTYLKDMGDQVTPMYARFRERYDKRWDYAIFVGRFIDGTQLRSGRWPSSRAIYSVEVNGVPVAAVYENVDQVPLLAQRALKGGRLNEAIDLFEKEVSAHPDNDIAWKGLGQAYLNTNNLAGAEEAFNKALDINPGDSQVLNYLGIINLNKNQIQQATGWFQKAVDFNQANYFANYYLAQISFQNNNMVAAQEYIQEALKYNPNFKDAYMLLADIYDKLGDRQRAAQIRNRFGG